MAGLQDLLEAYRNYRGTQEWKLGKQEEQMLGGNPQAMSLWEKLQGFGPADMGGIAGAIKAYHASPKLEPFTKFSKKFMGSGEGAQEFGYGHYFSERPRDVNQWFPYGSITPYPHTTPQHSIYEVSLEWPDAAKELATPLTKEDFFQWNKSLENQPENVRVVLEDIISRMPERWAKEYIKRPKQLLAETRNMYEPEMYERGIPGVAFKFGGKGPTNYSVFGDEIPRVISHNKPSIIDLLNKR